MRLGGIRAFAAVIAVVAWAFAGGTALQAQTPSGEAALSALVPHPPKARGERCVEEPDFMRRNHMGVLKHRRDEAVHEGVRSKSESLKSCISCHAVKGDDGQFVKFSDERHFCRSCHDYAAVSIDCFQCHASRPGAEERATLEDAAGHEVFAALSRYLREKEGQQ